MAADYFSRRYQMRWIVIRHHLHVPFLKTVRLLFRSVFFLGPQYFYNAQTQEYLYWDANTKTYIPVPGGTSSTEPQSVAMTAEVQAILSNPAADAPLEMKKQSEQDPDQPEVPASDSSPTPTPVAGAAAAAGAEAAGTTTSPTLTPEEESARREKDGKEEKPRSLAAVKVRDTWLLRWCFFARCAC